jgi:hypothetical protein
MKSLKACSTASPRGMLGETLVITPPPGGLGARRLLLIGLGDSQDFAHGSRRRDSLCRGQPSRRGPSVLRPTILDGGVTRFTTGGGCVTDCRRLPARRGLPDEKAAAGQVVASLTYLAGASNVASTRAGIERAVAGRTAKWRKKRDVQLRAAPARGDTARLQFFTILEQLLHHEERRM